MDERHRGIGKIKTDLRVLWFNRVSKVWLWPLENNFSTNITELRHSNDHCSSNGHILILTMMLPHEHFRNYLVRLDIETEIHCCDCSHWWEILVLWGKIWFFEKQLRVIQSQISWTGWAIKLLTEFGSRMKCDYKVIKLIIWCSSECDFEYNSKEGVYR